MYDGDDLFYKQEQTNNWANIEGGLYHINMAGWGDTAGMQRKALTTSSKNLGLYRRKINFFSGLFADLILP